MGALSCRPTAVGRRAARYVVKRQRLLNGEDLVDLLLRHYERLDAGWRSRIPQRTLLVVDDTAGL